MERLKERLHLAEKALAALNESLALPYSKIVRDASIQRFEFTIESLWKLAQRFLIVKEGIESGSPKGVIKACFQVDLLTDQQTHLLLQAIDDRNLTVHTYNEALAEKIYANLFEYRPVLNEWHEAIKQRLLSKGEGSS